MESDPWRRGRDRNICKRRRLWQTVADDGNRGLFTERKRIPNCGERLKSTARQCNAFVSFRLAEDRHRIIITCRYGDARKNPQVGKPRKVWAPVARVPSASCPSNGVLQKYRNFANCWGSFWILEDWISKKHADRTTHIWAHARVRNTHRSTSYVASFAIKVTRCCVRAMAFWFLLISSEHVSTRTFFNNNSAQFWTACMKHPSYTSNIRYHRDNGVVSLHWSQWKSSIGFQLVFHWHFYLTIACELLESFVSIWKVLVARSLTDGDQISPISCPTSLSC